jgi:UDP:flavonoid glycosyltransferase YjiC (YdhE family)
MKMKNNKVLVAAAAFNWAESHRMASIGLTLKQRGMEVYSLGSGIYDSLLRKDMNHLTLQGDDKWYSDERIKKLMNMDVYGNDYCTEEELMGIVEEEIKLLNMIRPAFVVTGYRTTLSISCRYAKIPLVWVLSCVVSKLFFQKNLASMPERQPIDYVSKIKDKKTQTQYYSKLALKNYSTSDSWIRVQKKLGIPTFKTDLDIFCGDFNLMSDAAEIYPELFPLPREYRFCGPLFQSQQIRMPECVENYKERGRTKIFVSMGSSGEKEIFYRIIKMLKSIEADIFVATTSILNEADTKDFKENFFFSRSFPHKEIAEWVDLSIIHGGQGTVYTSLLAGKPFIGIPMFSEQQYNLENLDKYECMIRLSEKDINEEILKNSINEILTNKNYKKKAKKMRDIIMPYYKRNDYNSNIAANEILAYMENIVW